MAKENLVKRDCQEENDNDQTIDSLEEDLSFYYKLFKKYKSPIQFPCLANLYRNRKRIEFDTGELPLILRSALEEGLGLGWYWLKDINDKEMLRIIRGFFHEKTEIIDQIAALFPRITTRENMEEVIRMLRDRDQNVRIAAANAFVKLVDLEDKENVIEMLHDEDWFIRKISLEALYTIITLENRENIFSSQEKEDIIEMIYDADEDVKEAAARVFIKMATHQDRGRVVEMLYDEEEFARGVATKVFVKITTPRDRENIIEILHNVDAYAEEIVTETFKTITLEDREEMMDIVHKYIRRAVLDAFTRIAIPEDKEDVIEMLHDEDWFIRKISLEALYTIITLENRENIFSSQEKEDIIEMIYDADEDVKEAAARVFIKMATHQDRGRVVEMLYDEEEFARGVAARAFPQIVESDDKKDIVRILHIGDEPWEVRRPNAKAFARIATPEDKEDVTKILFDEDNYIQEIAAKTLVRIFESHEIETFLDFLSERAQGFGEKEERYFTVLSILDRELYCPYSSIIEKVRLKKESETGIVDSSESLDFVNYQKYKGEILKKELHDLDCGREKWREYEELVIEIFQYLFVPPLKNPRIQIYTLDRLERRDVLFPNVSDDFFWRHVREKYDSEFILIECKNYCKKIGKNEVRDASQYLRKRSIGRFGLIASRDSPSKSATRERKQEFIENHKLILFIDDRTLSKMIDGKIQNRKSVDVLDDLRIEFLSRC